jgi:low temperature requirement protein LtrA
MLGCGVFLVWAVTQLASVFFDQHVDPAVHGIMLAVVTGLFGGAYLVGRKNGGGGA